MNENQPHNEHPAGNKAYLMLGLNLLSTLR